jgi:hypothetical protein
VLVAVLIISAAVLAGTAVAFLPAASRALIGPIRILALAASLAVVFGHLLPEAASGIGVGAVLGFAAGVLLPSAAEAVGRRVAPRRDPRRLGLETGYAGLCIHQVGDGVALGAYAGPLGSAPDVAIAIAAHTVPLVAAVVLAYESALGRRAALLHAAGLAAASWLGILLAGVVPAAAVQSASGWIAAVVSGLLLHVVIHELGLARARS